MHQEQRTRAIEWLQTHDIHHALFAHPHTVTWLSGFTPSPQTGPNFFAGGPPLLWYAEGRFTLIVVSAYATQAAAFADASDNGVIAYPGNTLDRPIDGGGNLAAALRQMWPAPHTATRVGVEAQHVPLFVAEALRAAFPAADFVALDGALAPLRAIKTAEELGLLRENFALTDLGHAVARRTVAAGLREIDVWSAIRAAIEQHAGCRVPLGNDCVVGYRQANIGGWPQEYTIRPGDALIVDLSTIQHGYWSDSCATYYAGTPTETQAALHRTVAAALELAISLVKPGAVAREIDRQVREFIAQAGYPVYPHHTGHGVGVSGHEAPRIVPYNTEALEPGMVIMLEPGIYLPGETGVRLEDAVLVTETGAELLTHHDKSLT